MVALNHPILLNPIRTPRPCDLKPLFEQAQAIIRRLLVMKKPNDPQPTLLLHYQNVEIVITPTTTLQDVLERAQKIEEALRYLKEKRLHAAMVRQINELKEFNQRNRPLKNQLSQEAILVKDAPR